MIGVLASHGARYRFGAPLDVRWLAAGRDALEVALDRERRTLMRTNEECLARYQSAAQAWAGAWSDVHRDLAGVDLRAAHGAMVRRAEGLLPFQLGGGP